MKYLLHRFSQTHKALLMLADLLVFLLAVFCVHGLRFQRLSWEFLLSPVFVFSLGLILSCLYIFGAYEFTQERPLASLFARIGRALFLSFLAVTFLTFILAEDRLGVFGRGVLIGSLLLFFILSSGPRLLVYYFVQRYHREFEWIFLVSSDGQEKIQKDLNKNGFQGRISWIVNEEGATTINPNVFLKLRSTLWAGVIVAIPDNEISSSLVKELMEVRLSGQRVMDICEFYERHWQKVPIDFVQKTWFVMVEGFVLVESPMAVRLKRFTDVLLALTVLTLTWPLMILTALAVRLESSGPALFKQERVGKNGRVFRILKFRSMVTDAEKNGAQWASVNDSRITRVGRFIRKTRLDELPQMFNILKGEMSFIGPRPERAEFNKQIEAAVPYYNVRHLVRPGLTGWAQVLFPYGASIEDAREKLQYEIYYIKNYSLLLDFTIILKTVSVVLLGRGR